MDRIQILQAQKSELLQQFNKLAKVKKRLYSNMDISSPMSAEEKKLTLELARMSSEMQKIIREIRNVKLN